MVGRVEQARRSLEMKLVCVCHCGTKGVLRQKDTEINLGWGLRSSPPAAEGDAVGKEGSGVICCSVGTALAAFPEELRSECRDPCLEGDVSTSHSSGFKHGLNTWH